MDCNRVILNDYLIFFVIAGSTHRSNLFRLACQESPDYEIPRRARNDAEKKHNRICLKFGLPRQGLNLNNPERSSGEMKKPHKTNPEAG